MSVLTIAYQQGLFMGLPRILNCKEFTEYVSQLKRIDELLALGNVEAEFIQTYVEHQLAEKRHCGGAVAKASDKEIGRWSQFAAQALRCNIAGFLTNESLRDLSCHIAESPVLQKFCLAGDFDMVRVPGKSLLGDYRNAFPVEMIQSAMDGLLATGSSASSVLGLADPLETSQVFIDSTCLLANVHFPVDWVLLRDGVRTIVKGIIVLREHGFRHRMPKPESFLRSINTLCMEMTNCRRKAGARKMRKKVLRKMKALSKVVEEHGCRYVALLNEERERTDLSEAEAALVIRRITNVIEQLPDARDQAHRRIITGKLVPNADKILSLYDADVSIIKRGKSNAEVEFGNELFVAEQKDGVIVDWKLYRDRPPADTAKLPDSLLRLTSREVSVTGIASDRGFHSEDNEKLLARNGIFSALCPRSPADLQEAMKNEQFRRMQKRRAQTEARIAILKNGFTGNPTLSRVFEYRERQVAWAIFTHNLWVVARLPKEGDGELSKAA